MSFNSQSSRVDFDLFGEDNDISSNSRVILQNKQRKSAHVHNHIAYIAGKISGGVFFFRCMKLDNCFRARLQGVEVTGNMALKTSGNPFRKHQQSTGQSTFLVSESDFYPLLHFGCFGSEITLFHYFQSFSVIFFFGKFLWYSSRTVPWGRRLIIINSFQMLYLQ